MFERIELILTLLADKNVTVKLDLQTSHGNLGDTLARVVNLLIRVGVLNLF